MQAVQHSMLLNPGSDWAVIKWIGDLGYSSQPWQFKGGCWQHQQSIQSFSSAQALPCGFCQAESELFRSAAFISTTQGCSGRDSIWKEVWCSFLIPVIPSVRESRHLHGLWIKNLINPCFSEHGTLGDVSWKIWWFVAFSGFIAALFKEYFCHFPNYLGCWKRSLEHILCCTAEEKLNLFSLPGHLCDMLAKLGSGCFGQKENPYTR